jgi:tetratricopeptide (TPR) repeat protein
MRSVFAFAPWVLFGGMLAALGACAPAPNAALEPAKVDAPTPAATVNVPPPDRSQGAAISVPDRPKKNEAPVASDDRKTGRDPRRSVSSPRQRALVQTEVQGLEQLFAQVAQTAPDRPTIARRLAEDYVELETASIQEGSASAATAARAKAIHFYSVIRTEYPSYPQFDEVLYYLAYEYEQASDMQNARKTYFELVQKRPDSKYIPNAYLAFGEMFYQDATNDPSKLDLAAQAYKEVIKYPPPANAVYGYAWYKLAWIATTQGETEKALNGFKKTIDFGTSFAQLPGAGALASAARKDIIQPYAQKGNPSYAYNFFRTVSGDVSGSNDKTFEMMQSLGQAYMDTGHYADANILFKDLAIRDAAHACRWQVFADYTSKAAQSGGKPPPDIEVTNGLARCPS